MQIDPNAHAIFGGHTLILEGPDLDPLPPGASQPLSPSFRSSADEPLGRLIGTLLPGCASRVQDLALASEWRP